MRHLQSFLAIALLAGAIALVPTGAAQAQSIGGTTNPYISFDAPIYPGHNNGFAEGPVGALTTLSLHNMTAAPVGWSAGATANVWVYPAQTAPHSTCSGTPGSVNVGATSPLDSSGGASLQFVWPGTAPMSAGPDYGACVSQGGAVFFSTVLDVNAGVGFYDRIYILTNAFPTLAVAPLAVTPGGTVTVTGTNWGPIFPDVSDSAIAVAIGHCNSGFSLGGATVTALSGGAFSVSFTIPASQTPTTGVQACAASGYQHIDALTGTDQAPPSFDIVAAPAPHPATPTPVPTHVPTPVPTPVPAHTPTPVPTPGHSGGGPCSSGMVALFGGCMALVFVSRRTQRRMQQRMEAPPDPR